MSIWEIGYVRFLEDVVAKFIGRIWENPFYSPKFAYFWWEIEHGGFIENEPICAYFYEKECIYMDCLTCVDNEGWLK